jgi:UbiD family decarboxylase
MKDMREWLDKVDNMGELLCLDNADWNLEIGCIEEVASQKQGKRPVLLFDKIKDYPQGYRIVANVLGSLPRLCLTAGFPSTISRWNSSMGGEKNRKS